MDDHGTSGGDSIMDIKSIHFPDKPKSKDIKDIDWDKVKNKILTEPVLSYWNEWKLVPPYNTPEKLIEWFKQTLENI